MTKVDIEGEETDFDGFEVDQQDENEATSEFSDDLDDFQVNLIEDYESVPQEDRNCVYYLYRPII